LWVPQSETYALVQRHVADLTAQLDARTKQLAALTHERDELARHVEAKQAAAEVRGGAAPGGAGRRGVMEAVAAQAQAPPSLRAA
jgi:hypothetical protein